jgi:hypothetical protein
MSGAPGTRLDRNLSGKISDGSIHPPGTGIRSSPSVPVGCHVVSLAIKFTYEIDEIAKQRSHSFGSYFSSNLNPVREINLIDVPLRDALSQRVEIMSMP